MSSTRRLAAILFADIQGYTALMQSDEANAISLREKLKTILGQEVITHKGTVIKWSGDGVLCIFDSAIEAVRSSIEIQNAMQMDPVVPLRIGIHAGDVIFDNDDVHGDGVNVASRIESFAVPGSVFISGKVYDEIKNQKDIQTASLGKYELKNVELPVEIFAITNDKLIVPNAKDINGKGDKSSGKKFSYKKIILIIVFAELFLYGGIFLYKKYFTTENSVTKLNAIGVIPFVNLSTQKDDEYFADGMCNEIMTQLSKIASLNVISRTSMNRFKDSQKPMKEIGNEVGADVLLEGSVQKSNDKIRINIQLFDAKHDKQLWAETYDKEFRDIFSIQSDVAQSVAQHLKANLTSNEKALIEKKPTTNLEAYNAYLKGNYLIQKVTPVDLANGLALLNKSIELDPKFALPYIGISYYYFVVTDFYMAPKDALPAAKIAMQTAIQMDSATSHAHAWLGMYEYWYAWNWKIAEKEFKTALELEPNFYFSYWIYSWFLVTHKRFDEAKAFAKRAAELEPMSPEEVAFYGWVLFCAKDYDEALRQENRALDLDPNYPFARYFRGICYLKEGKLNDAIAEYKKAHELFAAPWSHARLAYAYARAGKTKEAISILDSLKKQFDTVYVASDIVASVYVALGDKDHAFEYLNKAIAERAGWMVFIAADPIWDPIRNDKRFAEVLGKMGLN